MKKTGILSIALLLLLSGCKSGTGQQKKEEKKAPATEISGSAKKETGNTAVTIDNTTVTGSEPFAFRDMGTISSGEIVRYPVTVANLTDFPLILHNVTASCGCTSVEFDKEPVMTGDTRTFTVVYDSKGRVGKQAVTIRLETDRGLYAIRLTVFVKE